MTEKTDIHISGLDSADKHAWLLSARIANRSFSEWVQDTLNAAKIDANPPWMYGLSERTRVGLLCAGFDSRESVERAMREGYDFVQISNFGRRCERELKEWLFSVSNQSQENR